MTEDRVYAIYFRRGKPKYCTILGLNDSRLHLVQVLFDAELLVLDHLLLLVHSLLDLLAHHLESQP